MDTHVRALARNTSSGFPLIMLMNKSFIENIRNITGLITKNQREQEHILHGKVQTNENLFYTK